MYLVQSEASRGLKLKGLEEIPRWIQLATKLYNRCLLAKEIELPCSGGVDQQPEYIMRILEIISEERSNWLAQKQEKLRREIESQGKGKRKGFFRRRN